MKILGGIIGLVLAAASVGLLCAEDAPKTGEGAISPEQIKKQLLEKFDANGDGNLTGNELLKAQEAMLKQFGAGAGAGGFNFEEFKQRFDRDGDGELNPQERAAAMSAFQKARTSGGGGGGGGGGGFGGAGGAGGAGGFGGGGGGFGGADANEGGKVRGRDALIKRFDRNGDGKLSEDEKAEAQKAMKAKKGEKAAPKLSEALKKFDTDGDGKLSDEEKAAIKKDRKDKGKKPE